MGAPKPLSPKQLLFVELYLKGQSAKQAYIGAGYKAKGSDAESAASRLLRNVKVVEAVEAAREKGKGQAGITAEWWFGRLKREATRNKNPAAARVAALRVIGQAAGFVTDSVKVSGDKDNPLHVEGKHEHSARLPAAPVVAGVLRALGLPFADGVPADGAGQPVGAEGKDDPA